MANEVHHSPWSLRVLSDVTMSSQVQAVNGKPGAALGREFFHRANDKPA